MAVSERCTPLTKPTRTRLLLPLVSSQSVISKKRKWEAIGPDSSSIQLCPHPLSHSWTGHFFLLSVVRCGISVWKQAYVVVVCLLFAAFSPKGSNGFPRIPNNLSPLSHLTRKPTGGFPGRGVFSTFDYMCPSPSPPQGHLSEGYGKLCSIYLKLLITKMEFHIKVSWPGL